MAGVIAPMSDRRELETGLRAEMRALEAKIAEIKADIASARIFALMVAMVVVNIVGGAAAMIEVAKLLGH